MTHLIHFCEEFVDEAVSRLVERINIFIVESEMKGKVEKVDSFIILSDIILQQIFCLFPHKKRIQRV